MSYETEVFLVYVPSEGGFTRCGRVSRFTRDFSKARMFTTEGNAKKSKNYQEHKNNGAFIVPAKVTIDPMNLFLLKLKH